MKIPFPQFLKATGPGSRLLVLVLLLFAVGIPLRAQDATDQAPATQDDTSQLLSQDDLNDLLGSIALYPDALVALILPASTVPSDITLAARFLDANGDNAPVDDQQWDDSVKGLAKYPAVLKWMDQNLEWTQSLGDAFVAQPTDVMDTIQELRVKARANGNLVDTPQQNVEVQPDNSIEIVPADPQVIYVPVYDPEVVYVQTAAPNYGPLITFGAGCAAGAWLSYDFNWGQRGLYHGNGYGWNNLQRHYAGGRNSVSVINNTTINTTTTNIYRWKPSANSVRQVNLRQQKHLGNTAVAGRSVNVNRTPFTNGEIHPARVPSPARSNEVRQGYPAQTRAPAATSGGGNQGHPAYGYDQPVPQGNRAPVKRTEIRPREEASVASAPPRSDDRPGVRQPSPQVVPRERVEIREPQHSSAAQARHPSASNGGGDKKGDGKKKKDNN